MNCPRKIVHHEALKDDTAACLERNCGIQLGHYTEASNKEEGSEYEYKLVAHYDFFRVQFYFLRLSMGSQLN